MKKYRTALVRAAGAAAGRATSDSVGKSDAVGAAVSGRSGRGARPSLPAPPLPLPLPLPPLTPSRPPLVPRSESSPG